MAAGVKPATGDGELARAGGSRAGELVPVAVVALTVVHVGQATRVLFPLVYDLGERTGDYAVAGLYAITVFLAPVAAPLLRRVAGPRWSLAVAIASAVALRLVLQLLDPIPLAAATAATIAGLVALALIVATVRGTGGGGDLVVFGLLAGLALDTGVRVAFWTWDPAWQDSAEAATVAAVLGGALLVAAWRLVAPLDSSVEPTFPHAFAAALVGPFLVLHLLYLQNPAFVDSQAGVPLAAGAGVVLAGNAVAVAAAARVGRNAPGRMAGLAAGTALVLLVYAVRVLDGPVVLPLLVAAHPLAAGLLSVGLTREADPGSGRPTAWRTAIALTAGLFVMLLVTFGYQIHYDSPLPVSNVFLPPFAAALLGLTALRGARPVDRTRGDLAAVATAAVPLALLAIPVWLAVTGPERPTATLDSPSFRVVNYNLHSAVDLEGQLDPEAVAALVEAQAPDVLVLQEVARGWPISGTIDLLEWLSQRLALPYRYAPAADHQFGNAILSAVPIVETSSEILPAAGGPTLRSYLWTVHEVAPGEEVNVIAVHLQHREQDTPARLVQTDVILDAWNGAPRTIFAGDFNAAPGSMEIRRYERAGLVSAQDAAGDPTTPTYPSDGRRIDWIFGTPDVTFSRFRIPASPASDHLPLVVDVTLTG